MPLTFPLESACKAGKAGEEWSDLIEHQASRRGEGKWSPFKQTLPNDLLELTNLRAHRRLLDAVRDQPQRCGDAAGARDIIKELEMMDIEHVDSMCGTIEKVDSRIRNIDAGFPSASFILARMNSEHRAAQKKAREIYYSEYSVQVCNVVRESKFKLDERVPA